MAKNKGAKKTKWEWTDAERQAYADGVRQRAIRIPNKKRVKAREACRRREDWKV
jgi:hypothetical protein